MLDADPRCRVDVKSDIVRRDEAGSTRRPRRHGVVRAALMNDRFEAVPGGHARRRQPGRRPRRPPNVLLRAGGADTARVRARIRHHAEAVGQFERLLPALYRRETGACDDGGVLKSLAALFDRLLPPAPGAAPEDAEHALRLATAVMLVEVMRADATLHAGERAAVLAALRTKFDLAPDEAERLADLAEDAARASTDLYTFTSRINERFDMPAKLRMIELMWAVAYADGHLADHERHVMWRIADLLHVPQGAYHHARQRAREAAGAG
jgi:uncharacterized tellurite resistance protein B-like protein